MNIKDLTFSGSTGIHKALDKMKSVDSSLAFVRMFRLYHFNENSLRGKHAHYKCWQYLNVVSGTVSLRIVSQDCLDTISLIAGESFLAPPLTWLELKGSLNTQIVVLCSHPYEKEDYIFNLDEIR